ncbi:MAG: ribonucleoside-diphosphate reductase, adenosylcobalamin-dependent, partial [Pollutimonas bauzanensis]
SKTVNVPADYPYVEFKNLYMEAWRKGLKGITTYRPNSVLGAVLSVPTATATAEVSTPQPITLSEQDKRLVLTEVAMSPPLASLRWPSRPGLPSGTSGWVSATMRTPQGDFAVAVSDQANVPFEVWVLGGQPPRGLDAIAKTLSTDMRANDRGWLRKKLSVLTHAYGEGFQMPMPPNGAMVQVPSTTAALAQLLEWRYNQLGALDAREGDPSPVL